MGERFHEVLQKIARHGFQIIFYLRMVPVIPYNALNLLAGASPIKFKDYFWASMIGMVPGTILFAFLGDALWHPMSPKFFLALLLIGLSVLCGEIWRRWSKIGAEEPAQIVLWQLQLLAGPASRPRRWDSSSAERSCHDIVSCASR